MNQEYSYILIHVRSRDESTDSYPVEAFLDDGSYHEGELHLDQPGLLSATPDPEKYGLRLFDALFVGSVRRAYQKSVGRAEAETEGRVRVRLWIDDDAAELHAIPWERLYHTYKGQAVPLSVSTLTPFSRYTGLQIAEPRALDRRPVRMLVAISNPSDLPPGLSAIDVELEVQSLWQALGDLRRNDLFRVILMPGRSGLSLALQRQLEDDGYQVQDGVTSLDNILRQVQNCHVFHFLGHGHFERTTEHGEGTAILHLESKDGTWQPVDDHELVPRLAAIDPLPHLVFLAACESARRGPEHPFVGLGPKLVKAGVPAVVAMQDAVPVDLARQLTGDFYRHLLVHGLIDLALNQARLLLFRTGKVDWAIPILFSRLADNEIVSFPPDQSLQGTNELMAATEKVLAAARPQERGRELVGRLEGLLQEWQKSHQGLVDLESALRRTGEDPETFAENFSGFFHDFKDYFNSETWVDEGALIRAAIHLRNEVLPEMKPQMDDQTFDQVWQVLNQHVGTRQRLVLGFGELLDTMDEAVMEIKQRIDSGDVEGAIRRKRDFELQIAPNMGNSRKLLRQMSAQITTVTDLTSRMEAQKDQAQVVGSSELIDTVLAQSDRQQTFDTILQGLVTTHGVDEQVLQGQRASDVPAYVSDQIDQVIAAQRGITARGIPTTPKILYRLGMLAAYRRDYDVAVNYFRQAARADPEYAEAFQAISWLQQSRAMHDMQAKNYGAALEKLAEARAATEHIRPPDRALVMQGYIVKTQAQIAARTHDQDARQKYLAEAAQLFQRALQLNRNNAEAHNGVGNVEYMQGNLDAAIIAIERAIQLNPDYTAAHHDLGGVLVAKMKGWCRKALQAFERAYQLAEHDPGFSDDDRARIHGYISWLQQQCGQGRE